jgi:alkanesulfonate monooxygenase SsuD/methylene tetrahydromethanopterin reductase-like flavin-dependent oxidoreductase (luciferase family)
MPAGDAGDAMELAVLAEDHGWDGFFVWEPVWGADAWVMLAAAAVRTERIRLGTMLTPVSRRKPWELASQTATVDRLSNGRLILTVGLGAVDTGFAAFGEETDRRIRAELLDEGLAIVTGLWQGQPFSYEGRHYRVSPTEFVPAPPPVQEPIPIWAVGAWRRERSMQRARRYQGLVPTVIDERGARTPTVAELAQITAELRVDRPGVHYDVVVEGETPAADVAADEVYPWAAAGATWWLETCWWAAQSDSPGEAAAHRLRAGPPRRTG